MKNANVYGSFVGAERKPSGILEYHQKELSAYLAKARGPGESAMKVKLEPRPSGEAARVVFKEYEVPLDADAGLPANFVQNDGSDWSLGTPSILIPGYGVHDAWLDVGGDVWFTCNLPNKRTTLGKIDSKTGQVKLFKVNAPNGFAAQTHGMTRDPNGMIWFNINNGRGGIGRVDPKTEKIDVFLPPPGMPRPAPPMKSRSPLDDALKRSYLREGQQLGKTHPPLESFIVVYGKTDASQRGGLAGGLRVGPPWLEEMGMTQPEQAKRIRCIVRGKL